MVTYDIELCQGDADSVAVLLKENGNPVNLTGSTLVFSMKSETGTEYDIECSQGATINGVQYTFAQGGITIPFTSSHTLEAETFMGKIVATKQTVKTTFPSGSDYISVRVNEAV